MTNTSIYWYKFFWTLVSPTFHLLFAVARLKANFISSAPYRRLMAVGFTAFVLVVVSLTNTWTIFLVAWVFPLTILYQISALCQFLSEHLWGSTGSNEDKSHGRFCGEAPPFGRSFLAWLYWVMRMLFYHTLVRIAILPGEMPEHDWHHKSRKNQKDWPNGAYCRQREVEAGVKYTECWGLHTAIDKVFQSLAESPTQTEENPPEN